MELSEQDLARHYRWVRGLAMRLLADESAADDATQQSFLVAMTRPPPDAVPIRAWLAGILRNLVRSDRRTERRRAALLASAARMGETEPADDVVARTELEHRIAAAVLALPEPLRRTVLLRYREDMSSRQIAARTDVSPGTVRWRLARARALLRDRLAGEDVGRDRSWPLLAAALFAPRGGTAIGAAIVGAVTVKTKIAVATLLALGLLLLGLLSGGPGALVPPREEQTVTLAVGTSARGSQPLAETVDVAGHGCHVEGRTVDSAGRPLGGVTVEVAIGEAEATGATEGDGTFRIGAPAADPEVLEVTLEFSRRNVVTRHLTTYALAGEDLILGDVVLESGGGISGRVVNAAGDPVPGAKVGIHDVDLMPIWKEIGTMPYAKVTSGEDGTFEVTGLSAGWYRALAVDKESYYSTSVPVGVLPGEVARDVTVTLEPLGEKGLIEVLTLEADGTPIPRATVMQSYRRPGSSANFQRWSDGEGRLRIRVEHDVPNRLSMRSEDGRQVVATAMPGDRGVVLRLPDGPWREIRVYDEASGAPVTDFRASIAQRRGDSGTSWLLPEGPHDGGRLRLPVPDGPFEVRLTATGYRAFTAGPFEPERVPPTVHVALQAVKGAGSGPARIEGIVVSGGRPVEGAEVRLETDVGDTMLLSGFAVRRTPVHGDAARTVTEADGRFAVEGPGDEGDLFVYARSPGLASGEVGPIRVASDEPSEEVRVVLGQGGALEGVVRVPSGRTAAGIVVAISRGDAYPEWTRTDGEGRYRFGHLEPGRWQVELRERAWDPRTWSASGLDDGTPIPSNCEVREGAVTRHDLSLLPEEQCAIEGTFLLGVKPEPGYRAMLRRLKEPDLWRVEVGNPETHSAWDLRGPVMSRAQVLPDGTFSLSTAEPGDYLLVVEGRMVEGLEEITWEARLTLGPGVTQVRVTAGVGVAEGRIVGTPPSEERGHATTRIYLYQPLPDGSRFVGHARPGKDGTFRLQNVPGGRVYMRVEDESAVAVDVPAGGTARVEFTLEK